MARIPMISEEEFNNLSEDAKEEFGTLYMDSSKLREQNKELLFLAHSVDEHFPALLTMLFTSHIDFSPLGFVQRNLVTTPAGERVIVFEFGNAACVIASALRAINPDFHLGHGGTSNG